MYQKPFLSPMTLTELRTLADHFRIKPPSINRVHASVTQMEGTLKACDDAGLEVPAKGCFTLEELNFALAMLPTKLSFERSVALKNQLAASGVLVDENPAFERAYYSAGIMLIKAGLEPGVVYSVKELDAHFAKTDLLPRYRIEIKSALSAAGLLREEHAKQETPKPNAGAVRHLCAQLDIDPPTYGKLSAAAVNRAIRDKGFSVSESMRVKKALHDAGALE